MKPLWLNISRKIDPALVELCSSIAKCTSKLQIPYLIIGASARDLVMHYGYGAAVQRATTDIDFALQVPSWDSFTELKNTLTKIGFADTRETQRLIAPNGLPIDIVPFGEIADEATNIYWPPSNEFMMNVMGFQEAIDNAMMVRMSESPDLEVPVASPVGMILLKLIAWTDREIHMREKDAKDIGYLLSTYQTIPAVCDALYEDPSTLERYDWDLTLAAAQLLGMEAKQIALPQTSNVITALLNSKMNPLSITRLINDMSSAPQAYSRNSQLLEAFSAGFLGITTGN